MTLRELIRRALEGGRLDEEVIVRIVRHDQEGVYKEEKRVQIARVSTMMLGREHQTMIVVDEEDIEAAKWEAT